MKNICEKSLAGNDLNSDEILALLKCSDEQFYTVRKYACLVRDKYVGNAVHLRGLIEFSNLCTCDCRYCGIRKSNVHVNRYTMDKEAILEAAHFSRDRGYGSVVLQSGERRDEKFVSFVEDVVREISAIGDGELGITLSCGVQSPDVYRRWRDAGANRYLLRIETTDRQLFAALHPDGDFDSRKEALSALKESGYITGTGVMTGLPGQTVEMLARDVEYFRELGADMIGLGPYVTHSEAVLEEFGTDTPERMRERLAITYRMLCACRLVLRDVNIASATALSALDPENGRVAGLLSGANVVMPNTGSLKQRKEYDLYKNKPETSESLEDIRQSTTRAGCTLELFTQGNPPRQVRHNA